MKLFVALVGKTGRGRKGTSLNDVLRLFAKVAPDWVGDHLVRGGLSSGEGLIWAVRDAVTKWERDKKTRVLEEVVVDPGIVDKRLLVVEAEFANTLKVMSREGNNLSPVIRCAWDAGSLRTMTKNSPARATGAHIGIIGHITVEELRKYLSTTEAAAGFANRFLWVCVRRSKSLPEGGCLEESDLVDLERRLEDAVLFARDCGEVGLDEEVRADWRAVYGDLSAERTGLFDAVTARAEAQVRRLAVIYAVLDRAETVRRPHLRAALAVWQYCEASARYIFGDSMGDPVADEILRALRRSPDGLTRSEIHDLFGRNLRAPVVNRALGLLLTRGLAVFERKAPEKRGGRPTELWTAKKVFS